MRHPIHIPEMGESVSEAIIGAFLKQEGAEVKEGEEVIELETAKVNQVLYAPANGILHWKVALGDSVTSGIEIGWVEEEGEKKPKEETKPPEKEVPLPKEMPLEFPAPKKEVLPGGVVPEIQDEAKGRRKMSQLRKTIAKRLVTALHESAMLTTFNEVDMSAIMAIRQQQKESFMQQHGVKLGLMSFFVKAVVQGLKEYPDFNSYIEGEEIITRRECNIGIAVSSEKGLVVPVIKHCEQLDFPSIEKEIADFAVKARSSKLSIGDLEEGSFTITNGGVYGSLLSTPILNPPQVGILGMHKIMERPIAINKKVEIRPMMYLALSYDHRLIDGQGAVGFLVLIKELLENPERLMETL